MKNLLLLGAVALGFASCTQEAAEPCPPVSEPVGYNVLAEDFP